MSSLCPGVSKDDKESKGPSIRYSYPVASGYRNLL